MPRSVSHEHSKHSDGVETLKIEFNNGRSATSPTGRSRTSARGSTERRRGRRHHRPIVSSAGRVSPRRSTPPSRLLHDADPAAEQRPRTAPRLRPRFRLVLVIRRQRALV